MFTLSSNVAETVISESWEIETEILKFVRLSENILEPWNIIITTSEL